MKQRHERLAQSQLAVVFISRCTYLSTHTLLGTGGLQCVHPNRQEFLPRNCRQSPLQVGIDDSQAGLADQFPKLGIFPATAGQHSLMRPRPGRYLASVQPAKQYT